MAVLAPSVKRGAVTIGVPDVAAALDWYVALGFKEAGRWAEDGEVNYGTVMLGDAIVMFNLYLPPAPAGVTLWFYTDRIDGIYQLLKARQLDAAAAALAAGRGSQNGIAFEQDIEDMFYGARQFSIRDLNGYGLSFIQPAERR
jgi:catechol 2,3-dioxygenase-like lactoylglutathione lyase family enzyme